MRARGDGGEGDTEEHQSAYDLQLQRQPALQPDAKELRARRPLNKGDCMLACSGSLPEGTNVLATIDHLMRDAISMHSGRHSANVLATIDQLMRDVIGGGQSQSAAIGGHQPQ